MATRTGMADFRRLPGEHYPDKWARRFAIDDFVGGDLKAAAPKAREPVITLSSGGRSRLNPLRRAFRRLSYRLTVSGLPDSTAPVVFTLPGRL